MRIVLALLLVAACSKSESAPPAPSASATTAPTAMTAAPGAVARAVKDPAKAREMIAGGAVVLDVRTAEEYSADRISPSTNIPIQELSSRLAEVEKLTGGDRSKPVVVYCASGARSAKASKLLAESGYTNVVNGGGIDDLK